MSVERGGSPLRLLMLIPVPWVFVLAYLAGVGLEFAVPLPSPINAPGWTWIAGLALFAMGAAIAGWSLTLFHRSRTTTVPGEWSRTLVTSGPYRFTRNPMYVGLTLAYLGEAGLLRQIWPVVLLPLVLVYLNWIVIPVEEARLHEAFAAAYRPVPGDRPALALSGARPVELGYYPSSFGQTCVVICGASAALRARSRLSWPRLRRNRARRRTTSPTDFSSTSLADRSSSRSRATRCGRAPAISDARRRRG